MKSYNLQTNKRTNEQAYKRTNKERKQTKKQNNKILYLLICLMRGMGTYSTNLVSVISVYFHWFYRCEIKVCNLHMALITWLRLENIPTPSGWKLKPVILYVKCWKRKTLRRPVENESHRMTFRCCPTTEQKQNEIEQTFQGWFSALFEEDCTFLDNSEICGKKFRVNSCSRTWSYFSMVFISGCLMHQLQVYINLLIYMIDLVAFAETFTWNGQRVALVF